MNDDIFDRAESLGGVPILGLLPHSPAALAGVRVGDVLLQVDGQDVASLGDYVAARRAATGRTMRLRLVRAGVLMEVELDLDHGAHRQDETAAMTVLRHIFSPSPESEPQPVLS